MQRLRSMRVEKDEATGDFRLIIQLDTSGVFQFFDRALPGEDVVRRLRFLADVLARQMERHANRK